MDNNEVNALIDAFVGYREMLVPIQTDMHEFLETYGAMKNDVDKLNAAFSGDVQGKLADIYTLLESQAEKSEAWQIAIGLQQVDGLKTSAYLLDTAKEHIEGKISIDEARKYKSNSSVYHKIFANIWVESG